jgi:CBS domain-containing protein
MIKYAEVRDLMTRPVVTLHPSDTMEQAATIFDNQNFHHIPIVGDDHKIAGMISRHDYYKILNAFTIFETENSRTCNRATLRALLTRDVMTKQIATIRQDDPLEKAVGIFQENLFHALPVVNEQKELVGILTTFDLLNYAFKNEMASM